MTFPTLSQAFATALLGALALGLAVPVAAQDRSASALAEEAVAEAATIPFAPPLGMPTTYAMRFERKGESTASVYDYEQRLTFARAGEGYLLRLETLSLTVDGTRFALSDKAVMDAIPAGLQPFLLPMTVELDAAGEIVRMRDWQAVQAGLRALPETAAALSGVPQDAAGKAALAQVLGPIINASAEEAPALIIRGWPSVLGFGGLELDLGESYEADSEIDGGLANGAIPAVVQLRLTRAADGSLRLFQSTTYDAEAMRAATEAAVETMRAQAGKRGKPAGDASLDAMQVSDTLDVVFDPASGLPITAEVLRIVSVDSNGENAAGGEVMTIRRIAP